MSYNLFPDEKGTESESQAAVATSEEVVTTYSPTKRGLKVTEALINLEKVTGYNLFPDEKGTERFMKSVQPVYFGELQPIPRRKGD